MAPGARAARRARAVESSSALDGAIQADAEWSTIALTPTYGGRLEVQSLVMDRFGTPSVEGPARGPVEVSVADEFASFEDFFAGERDRLFGLLVLVTGDRHEAEDLAQDAFVATWERWDRVRAVDNPVGYLHRTAMNAFRKRYRRAQILRRITGSGRDGQPPQG